MGVMGEMGEMGFMGRRRKAAAYRTQPTLPLIARPSPLFLCLFLFLSLCMETKKAAASRLLPILYRIEKLKFYFMKLD